MGQWDDDDDPADWWKPRRWEPVSGPDGRVTIPRSVLKNPTPWEQRVISRLFDENRARIVKDDEMSD
jgi:hypothetical protein